MNDEIRKYIIITVAIVAVVLMLLLTLEVNNENKRIKIDSCIEQTGNIVECKCAYRDCYDRDLLLLNVSKE